MNRISILLVATIAIVGQASSNTLCLQNWQCESLECQGGLCTEPTATISSSALSTGSACLSNLMCESGCCKENVCAYHFLCSLVSEIEEGYDVPVEVTRSAMQEARDFVQYKGVIAQGPCKADFQCQNECCLDGHCQMYSNLCMKKQPRGERCYTNDDCKSGCCHHEFCSRVQKCAVKKHNDTDTPCKYNSQCHSGCCAFDKCQHNDFFCIIQKPKDYDCFFNQDCKSSCCHDGKCSATPKCYSTLDHIQENDAQLSIFYQYLLNQ